MHSEEYSQNPPVKPPPEMSKVAVLQLAAGLILTFAVLPYVWGRVAILWMLVGAPERRYAILFLLTVLAVIVVTRNLSTAFGRPRLDRWVLGSVAAFWIAWNILLLALKTGPLLAWWWVALAFVPATLWVVWLAWMFYRPLLWRTRLGVLLLLLLLGGGGLALVKAEGLTGAADVNFAWRWGKHREGRLEDVAGVADLARTTPYDYAQFLGRERLGILPEARLARDWQQQPPRLVWRHPVGAGWSSFAVVGDYALTQEQRGDQECTICYRVADGTIVWSHGDPVRFDKSLGGPGPRATPTIVGGRVYTLGATGLLNCLDGATGKSIWKVDILADNGGNNISHGVCSSPLVTDDMVIVCPTGGAISLAAYDAHSGHRIWQAGGQEASYGSPLLADIAGVRQILIHAADGVAGHDPATGKQLWFFPWTNGERINCAQPIPNAGAPGRIFAGTGYDKGSILFQVERASDGSWSCTQLWKSRFMKLKYTTAVLHRSHLYGLDDGILECLDLETGKRTWKDGRYGHGQILLAGALLLVQAESGEVVLVEPAPDGLHELGRVAALDGKTWNNPALAGKYLLVRNDHEAACFELPLEVR